MLRQPQKTDPRLGGHESIHRTNKCDVASVTREGGAGCLGWETVLWDLRPEKGLTYGAGRTVQTEGTAWAGGGPGVADALCKVEERHS